MLNINALHVINVMAENGLNGKIECVNSVRCEKDQQTKKNTKKSFVCEENRITILVRKSIHLQRNLINKHMTWE